MFYSEDTSTKSQWQLYKIKYSVLIELEKAKILLQLNTGEKLIWKIDAISWKENMICM